MDPPKNFIVRGPYRYVRNPILIGVNFILISEYLILNSLIIFVWSSIFIVINLLYHKFNEEKKLELKFGNSYIEYKKNGINNFYKKKYDFAFLPGWVIKDIKNESIDLVINISSMQEMHLKIISDYMFHVNRIVKNINKVFHKTISVGRPMKK